MEGFRRSTIRSNLLIALTFKAYVILSDAGTRLGVRPRPAGPVSPTIPSKPDPQGTAGLRSYPAFRLATARRGDTGISRERNYSSSWKDGLAARTPGEPVGKSTHEPRTTLTHVRTLSIDRIPRTVRIQDGFCLSYWLAALSGQCDAKMAADMKRFPSLVDGGEAEQR